MKLIKVGRPALSEECYHSTTGALRWIKRREEVEHQESFPSVSWSLKQCEQWLSAPAIVTSLSWWTVAWTVSKNKPFFLITFIRFLCSSRKSSTPSRIWKLKQNLKLLTFWKVLFLLTVNSISSSLLMLWTERYVQIIFRSWHTALYVDSIKREGFVRKIISGVWCLIEGLGIIIKEDMLKFLGFSSLVRYKG